MPRYPFSFGPNSNPNATGGKRQLGDGRLFNAYVEPIEEPGKDQVQYALHSDAGLDLFTTFTGDADNYTRGLFGIGDTKLYAVAGEHLYRVNSAGVASLIGTVTGVRPVITSVNRNAGGEQVVITSDTQVYEMQLDTLQVFQDADLGNGVAGTTYLDGYTIILLRSGVFQWTGLNTLDIDPLDFAEAEARADGGILPFAYESKLWLFGAKTIEVWSDVGTNADLPFERDTVIERGALSKYAITPFDETLAFVDDLGRCCRMVGYGVSVFSTPAVERDIRRTMDLQQATKVEAFAWTTGGHQFLVVCGHDWTWTYDAATKFWHPKDSFGLTYWKGRGYLRFFDRHLVGSHTEARLYDMHQDHRDEYDAPLNFRIRSPIIGAVDKTTEFNQLDIDINMAAGLNSSDINESNPLAQVRWSDDGGHTWSASRIHEMGRIGEYFGGKIRLTRLGTCMSGRGRMFELTMSHPVERMLLEAVADIQEFAA